MAVAVLQASKFSRVMVRVAILLARVARFRSASSSWADRVQAKAPRALCCAKNLVWFMSPPAICFANPPSPTPLGFAREKIMDSGELVSDEIMREILAERTAQTDVQNNGVLLDGFPRTVAQAESLSKIVGTVHGVINLEVSIAKATERMLLRNRDDDTEESIARRLALYEEQTVPLLSWYDKTSIVKTVDGMGTEAEVFEHLAGAADEILARVDKF